jgi:ribonuclease J
MSNINIVALGGVQETGKNLYVVEVDNDLFILDAGMKYPSSDIRGVDIIIPDISYIISNSNKVRGIFLSHAHDDHIMAVPHILKCMRIPVYASKFTIAVLKELLIENGLNPIDFQLIAVDEGSPIRFGKTFVKFINVSHSVPQSMAISIGTVDGNILYTGNFNFDQNGKNLYQTNVEALCKVAGEGVLALLPECISTVSEINRSSINEFTHRLSRIFMNASGRIIISLFSTNLQRIQQIVDMAVEYNKKIAIIGRKTQRIVNIAINAGYLNVEKDCLVNLRYIDDKNKNNQEDLVVLVTGERHEPYYMLQRMCRKIDRLINIESKDTIVVLTRPAIGTEKMAARTLDMLFKESENVVIFPNNLILSASSGTEEAKQMINLTRPKYILPVIGEYRHQYNFFNLAKSIGIKDENLIVVEAGKMMSFKDGQYQGIFKVVTSGDILLDGKGLGDINNAVLRDRELLAESGVLMVVANVDAKRRKVVSGPQFISKGFYFDSEEEAMMKEIFDKVTAKTFTSKFLNWVEYKNDIKTEISKYLVKKTKTNPMVISAIISTEIE